MYRFLLTPRWLRIHLLLVVLVPAFLWLGNWQRDLFVEHHSANERISHNVDAAPVPLTSLLPDPSTSVGDDLRYRRVTVSGVYDTTHQLLARHRSDNSGPSEPGVGGDGGRTGFDVLTPLVMADGRAVLVNRGWIGLGSQQQTSAPIPPPPAGTVTVTGRVQPPEQPGGGRRDNLDVPAGQVELINTARIGQGLPYPLYTSFVELTAETPEAANAPHPVAPPGGTSTTIYLVYVIQWWLFVVLTIGFWIMLIRREAADLRAGRTPDGNPLRRARADASPGRGMSVRGTHDRDASAGVTTGADGDDLDEESPQSDVTVDSQPSAVTERPRAGTP